ncbi:DUF397 domain-containing protein [Saccharopolyspora oryzae]|uniref:DUF397 domain-containing protein n=1 Tax=Saccharopolyspora oryzae TaxID=2997343 RepID=A0ABT4UZB7_9PSEU|nr:DUF397 domain-containing protein [Saccharopolyspora oryzae]MDA3626402.1 DUF397 domain-containing protein [Saccharopolyspora oryzae]
MRPEPVWKKASRSGQANACVEVATNLPGLALVRDSKLGASSPILSTTDAAFATFISEVKAGTFEI